MALVTKYPKSAPYPALLGLSYKVLGHKCPKCGYVQEEIPSRPKEDHMEVDTLPQIKQEETDSEEENKPPPSAQKYAQKDPRGVNHQKVGHSNQLRRHGTHAQS